MADQQLQEAAYQLEAVRKRWWHGEGGRQEEVINRMAETLVLLALHIAAERNRR